MDFEGGIEEGEAVSVGVIGAERRMTPLLSRMLEYDYVDVQLVVDRNPAAPGILIAESLGVPVSQEPQDLLDIIGDLDFVFCIDDDEEFRHRMIDEFRDTNNRHTVLLGELATRLIMSLCKDARELMQLAPPPAPGETAE